jgi:hypothetical protein
MFIVHMHVHKTHEVEVLLFNSMYCFLCSYFPGYVRFRVSVSYVSVILVVRYRSIRASVCIEIGYVACAPRFGVRTLTKIQLLFHVWC